MVCGMISGSHVVASSARHAPSAKSLLPRAASSMASAFANAASAGKRQEPRFAEQPRELMQLLLASNEASERRGYGEGDAVRLRWRAAALAAALSRDGS